MPDFSQHQPGSPSWIDLMSPDVDGSRVFYQEVFGWDADDLFDDNGNRIYTMFRLDGKDVAGLGGQPPDAPPMPPVWNTYVAVEDARGTAERVAAAGGQVMVPPMQVMESGHMAMFVDPTGAPFAVWQPNEHIGAQVCNEPNTWAWNELVTRDVDTARNFYSEVFDWSYQDVPMGEMGNYTVVEGGENGGWAGMMAMPPQMPEQVPNHWQVYFLVDDTDKIVAKVQAAGGSVVQEPFESSVGTITIFHDNRNGSFATLQPPAQADA